VFADLEQFKNRDAGTINVPNLLKQIKEYIPNVKKEPANKFARKFSAPEIQIRRTSSTSDLNTNPRPGTPTPVVSPALSSSPPQAGTASLPPLSPRFMVRKRSFLGNEVTEGEQPKSVGGMLTGSAISRRLAAEASLDTQGAGQS